MSEEQLQTLTYRILRYSPNLIRDEWLNVGVLLHDPAHNTLRVRMLEEDEAFARLRKLRFDADDNLLRALQSDLEAQAFAHKEGAAGLLRHLDDTLSNLLQMSPQRAVLAANLDSELERLYVDHVAPPRSSPRSIEQATDTRAGIRARTIESFRRGGILARMQRGIRTGSYTFPGDPLRIDFAWRSNGTRGFVHTVALARDPRLAKEFAYTAERIRAQVTDCQLTAVTETQLVAGNERHDFVARVFAEQNIEIVPVPRLDEFTSRLWPLLQ